ncbi:MAG: hypothetical protein AB7O74_06925 [Candidatus Nanopelagicales bacterium]
MWQEIASASTFAVSILATAVAVAVVVVLIFGVASVFMPRARQRHALEVLDRFVALVGAVRGRRPE